MSEVSYIQIEDDDHDVVVDINAVATLESTPYWSQNVDFYIPDLNLPASSEMLHTSTVSNHQNHPSRSRILISDPVTNIDFKNQVNFQSGLDPDPDFGVVEEGNGDIPMNNLEMDLFDRVEQSDLDLDSDPEFGYVSVSESGKSSDLVEHIFFMGGLRGVDFAFGNQNDPDLDLEFLLNIHGLGTNHGFRHDDDYEGYVDEYTTEEYETLFTQFDEDDNLLFERPPASKALVENLDTVHLSEDDVENDNVICAVCKDEMNVGERAMQLPCSHRYHRDCIVPWLGIQNTCPVCRYELPTDHR